MTRSEALIYFPVTEEDALEDLYEQKLFEWKNFFVNRFPVKKLFEAKLSSLSKLKEAYATLGGVEDVPEKEYLNVQFSSILLEAFSQYSTERSRLKTQLFSATTFQQMENVVVQLTAVTNAYANLWEWEGETTAIPKISIETDSMDLLAALKEAQTMGVFTNQDIDKLPHDHLVCAEAKRLSLWLKSNLNE